MLRMAFFLSIVALAGGGMMGTAEAAPADAMPAPAAADGVETYALAAGDKLKITVFNVAEITGEYSISTAGNVALPLVGDVRAAGGTTAGLSDVIRTRLSAGLVKDPNVTVEVVRYRPFYILGEINKPGEFPYAANMTIEQAIAAAGGYTYRAARRRAFLRRAGGPEQVVKFGDQPIYVQPGDTIRIGERYL